MNLHYKTDPSSVKPLGACSQSQSSLLSKFKTNFDRFINVLKSRFGTKIWFQNKGLIRQRFNEALFAEITGLGKF